ncbi:hypothetical protein SAMN04487989_102262 [Bizionia echini]|uniref:Uncharacterized protein n=1 Tax=Bizionia echini TaxID=649333 RepID=A0A1I5ATK6_9FLAO|nr:hypothetical protein [Bizionia echini]SFN65529.1 hypothetical protein SAMN04487989_102262 [Bizionia echini]
MLLTITILLSFLVAVNFLLLIFSCNKTPKRASQKIENRPTFVVTKNMVVTSESNQLAPTGS